MISEDQAVTGLMALKVFSGSSHVGLATAVASQLETTIAAAKIAKFQNQGLFDGPLQLI